jgi:hypothetical protein
MACGFVGGEVGEEEVGGGEDLSPFHDHRPEFGFDDTGMGGYAFTYVLARAAGSFVMCYTHYPTISTDMLERVRSRASLYNNDVRISRR